MKRERRIANRTIDAGRFPISYAGWIGIGLIALGVAYFVLLPAAPGNDVERRPSPPEARGEATPPPHRLQGDLKAPDAVDPAGERNPILKRGDTLPVTDHAPSR